MSYLILRRKNGSIRLLLPADNAQVIRSACYMYYPSRLLGKVYRCYLVMFLPILSFFGLVERLSSLDKVCPHLDKVIKKISLKSGTVAAILMSDTGPRSKCTLKIMLKTGCEIAYARIAMQPVAREIVENEVRVLKELEQKSIEGEFPKLISSGLFQAPLTNYLIQSAGPSKLSDAFLTVKHLEYLNSLVNEKTINISEVIDKLKIECRSVITDKSISVKVEEVLSFLQKYKDFQLQQAIEHGDFAPWNIRKTPNGKLFVFDWEHADLHGLMCMDALHFTFQIESLVKRKTIPEVYHELALVFNHKVLSGGSCSMSASQRQLVIVLYLLRSIVTGHKEGLTSFNAHSIKIGMLNLIIKDFKDNDD